MESRSLPGLYLSRTFGFVFKIIGLSLRKTTLGKQKSGFRESYDTGRWQEDARGESVKALQIQTQTAATFADLTNSQLKAAGE